MKKFLSVLLAVMMLLSALPVMAEGTTEEHVCTPTVYSDDGLHFACEKDIVETKEATCTEAAYTKYLCQAADCNTEFKIHVGTALGHTPEKNTDNTDKGEMTTKPTCTTAGVVEKFCTVCEKTYTEPVAAYGHQWDVENHVVTPVTCETDGYTTETCTVCGATHKVDVVTKLGHDLDTKYIVEDATCDAEGDKVTVVIFEYCKRTDDKGNDICDYENSVDESSMYIENLSDFHQKEMDNLFKAGTVDGKTETAAQIAARIMDDVVDGMYEFDPVEYKNVTGAGSGWYIELCPAEVTYVAPTCTKDGSLTMVCSDEDGECKANKSIVIPAIGHDYTVYTKNEKGELVLNSKNDPSCLEDGSVIVTCKNGCDFIEQIEIEAPGAHKFEGTKYYTQVKPFETIKRTTDKGAMVNCLPYTVETACCGYSVTVVLSNGDDFSFVIPGCVDEDGNPILSDPETVAATEEHTRDTADYAVKHPTCTEAGFEIYNCTKCKTTHKTVLDPLNHMDGEAYTYDAEKDVVLPTCTEDGSITWTCELCKDVKVQVVPATGHGWDINPATGADRTEYSITVVTERTCTVDGVYTWHCNYCEATKTVTEKAGHTAPQDAIVTKEATCTKAGSTSYICTVCHKAVTEAIEALGHTWEREEGDKYYEYRDEFMLLPAEHNTTGKAQYYEGYVDATCENRGFYYRNCACPTCDLRDAKTGKDYSEVLPVTEKKPHLLVSTMVDKNLILDTTVLPTCQAAGKASFNCAVCGEYVEFEIPALPHNEQMTWNETKHVYEFTCEDALSAKYFAELKTSEYLYNEILACIDAKAENREEIARQKQNDVVDDLQKSLGQSKYVVGVGCDALLNEIAVNKTHYEASLKNNVVTLKAVENCALIENPWIIVSWAYELSDGTSMTVTMPFITSEVKNDKGEVVKTERTATIYMPEVDDSAKLICTTVAVTKTASVDLDAAYQADYGFDMFF